MLAGVSVSGCNGNAPRPVMRQSEARRLQSLLSDALAVVERSLSLCSRHHEGKDSQQEAQTVDSGAVLHQAGFPANFEHVWSRLNSVERTNDGCRGCHREQFLLEDREKDALHFSTH